jgi:hypothetical protein
MISYLLTCINPPLPQTENENNNETHKTDLIQMYSESMTWYLLQKMKTNKKNKQAKNKQMGTQYTNVLQV